MTHPERAARREAMAAAVRSGEDPGDVCVRFHCGMTTLRRACEAAGITLGSGAYRSVPSAAFRIVASLQNQDATARQIARDMGLSATWIFEVLKAARQAGIRFPGRDAEEPEQDV